MNPDRFLLAVERIDEVHREDPRKIELEGEELGYEVLYARRMTETLAQLEPNASEELELAARCQHIRRWAVPRDRFPTGRSGYLRWRAELAKLHAQTASEILRPLSYPEPMIERVRDLVLKKRFKTDPEAQALEDAACLVFLKHELADFAAKHEDDKVVDILARTWRKMSLRGQQLAKEIPLSGRERALLEQALSKNQ